MAFHWASFALVLLLIASGVLMTRLTPGGADGFMLYQLHKSLGVALLLLTTARIVRRAALRRSADGMQAPTALAQAVHIALYVALVAVPIVGWGLVSASPFAIPTTLFGWVTWPHLPMPTDLDPASRARIAEALSRVHAVLAYAFVTLVLLHAIGAVRGGRPTLARMVPGLRRRSLSE